MNEISIIREKLIQKMSILDELQKQQIETIKEENLLYYNEFVQQLNQEHTASIEVKNQELEVLFLKNQEI